MPKYTLHVVDCQGMRSGMGGKKRMVREARFELAQDCSRQPLKLVRLPFRHSRDVSIIRILKLIYCIS